MISGKQIRAARALLNLNQKNLANIASISAAALTAIEQEYSAPRASTLQKLERHLRSLGIKFTDGDGVALENEIFLLKVFEGKNAFHEYMQDVIETIKKDGSIAMHSHVDESSYIRHQRKVIYEYYKEMEYYGLQEKLLICEGITIVYGAKPMAEYRWIKKEFFSHVGYSVYGDKYAILFPNEKQRCVVIQNKELAETHRKQFEQNWHYSLTPRLRTPLYDNDKKTSII